MELTLVLVISVAAISVAIVLARNVLKLGLKHFPV